MMREALGSARSVTADEAAALGVMDLATPAQPPRNAAARTMVDGIVFMVDGAGARCVPVRRTRTNRPFFRKNVAV